MQFLLLSISHKLSFLTLFFLSLLLIVLFQVSLQGQNLDISKSGKVLSFDLNGYFEIGVDRNQKGDSECCHTSIFEGYILNINEKDIEMKVVKGSSIYKDAGTQMNSLLMPGNFNPNVFIKKTEIAGLKYYKSERSMKRKKAFIVTGGMLIFTGLATAAHYFIVGESENKNRLLYSAGIQGGLGIGFLISSSSKSYSFRNIDDPWKIK
ncbi:MAG: hypothetical protein HKN67_13195 [Saprospiraceae bacterium]|nr:hypothetical protein [Saprospiraceae bacterium]